MDADEGGRITIPGSNGDHVFVVRLWLERASGARNTALWRGRVTYLNTKQEINVGGIHEAFDAVRTALLPHSGGRGGPTG